MTYGQEEQKTVSGCLEKPPKQIMVNGNLYHRIQPVMDMGTGCWPDVIINGWSYAKGTKGTW